MNLFRIELGDFFVDGLREALQCRHAPFAEIKSVGVGASDLLLRGKSPANIAAAGAAPVAVGAVVVVVTGVAGSVDGPVVRGVGRRERMLVKFMGGLSAHTGLTRLRRSASEPASGGNTDSDG
jgi:hypothetical protein